MTTPKNDKEIRGKRITAEEKREKWFTEMRGWIMVIAVLVAGATYTAGLSPPGGFWQDNANDRRADNTTFNHRAGIAILRDVYYKRYLTFFYANATAFMASLVIIILLMNEEFYSNKYKVFFLNVIMVLDLVSLMIAYAAGCARSLRTSIYVLVLAAVVLVIVLLSAEKLQFICKLFRPCLPESLFQSDNDAKSEEDKHDHSSCQCMNRRPNA